MQSPESPFDANETVRDRIYRCYANLAMAHVAVQRGDAVYSKTHYMIRARLFKGLHHGTMNIRTLFEDEKIKIHTGLQCNYCGISENLSMEHLFPRKLGGLDCGDNLILACKSCNSSKGTKDLFEWQQSLSTFLPLLVIRRYIKITYNYVSTSNMLDVPIHELIGQPLPFKIEMFPVSFPSPDKLKLSI